MATTSNRIEYLRMEPADNGCIISYDECIKRPNQGTYDGPSYISRKEVFDFDDSDDSFDEAFGRFKELFLKYQAQSKENNFYLGQDKVKG